MKDMNGAWGQFKKDSRTGDPRTLMGYKVGSRAPTRSISSGTRSELKGNKVERATAKKIAQDVAKKSAFPVGPFVALGSIVAAFAAYGN